MTTEPRTVLAIPQSRARVYADVEAERHAQDAKWGESNVALRSPELGLVVLMEEIGEVAREILEAQALRRRELDFLDVHRVRPARAAATRAATLRERRFVNMRRELVQAAAVAVAMIEGLDRGVA